jgi:formiminotetrahydrofolate cyclodeaminase
VAELAPLICTAAEKGSRLAISDAGCAAVLAIAALKAAALNVTVNTRLMKNRETAAQLDAQVDALLADVPGQLERVYTQVNADLRGL